MSDLNNLNTPTIEEKAESKTFFTKRNVILMIFTIIVSAILLWVTIRFVLNIEWNYFFTSIGQGFTSRLGGLWFFLLIVFMVVIIVYNYFPFWVRLKKLGIKIPAYQYFTFGIIISFLKAVTPANFIYDPYAVFWLKTQGVSTARGTSIMFGNTLLWQGVQFILHIPSYVIVMTHASVMTDPGGVTLMFLMTLGIVVDIIGCLLMVLLCFSKKTHYTLSVFFNWIKKKLHMQYHTKPEIADKYQNKATIKREVIEYYHDWKGTLAVIACLAIYEIMVYFAVGFSMSFINDDQFIFDMGQVYNSANMAFNANRLNIIPGFGVGLEASLLYLLNLLSGINQLSDASPEAFVKNSIVFYRLFYTYIPALMGLFGFITLTTLQVRSYKKKKGGFIESKYE